MDIQTDMQMEHLAQVFEIHSCLDYSFQYAKRARLEFSYKIGNLSFSVSSTSFVSQRHSFSFQFNFHFFPLSIFSMPFFFLCLFPPPHFLLNLDLFILKGIQDRGNCEKFGGEIDLTEVHMFSWWISFSYKNPMRAEPVMVTAGLGRRMQSLPNHSLQGRSCG